MKTTRVMLLLAVVALIGAFFAFDLGRYFTLDSLRASRDALADIQRDHYWSVFAGLFAIYVVAMALSLPIATVLTLTAGALYGFWLGLALASFASTIGATFAFLFARHVLRESVRERFANSLAAIDSGVKKDGAFYLFAMRLVIAIPPAAINLTLGVTPMRTRTFYCVSQLGMLPATCVYVLAGVQLGQLESVSDILSPAVIGAFVLLGVFPLVAKKAVDGYRVNKALRRFTKPKRFDANMVVIGAGSGGLVAALIAATVKAKVTLVERHRMGGDCLNTGCVPSKSLLRSAKMLSYMARAPEFGFKRAGAEFDFAEVMERVRRIVKTIEPNDSVERYTDLGVDCVRGDATVASPWRVRVGDREITTRSIVVATGGSPLVPAIPGLREAGYVTSDTIWELRELPRRFVVLGGGPIGCELAQAFRRFGSEVTQVERNRHLLTREDDDVVACVQERFAAEGVRVLTGHEAVRVEAANGEKRLVCARGDEQVEVPFDIILVAVGRRPNTAGLGLAEAGVALDAGGAVEVDDYMRTSVPTIYACGDVTGPYQFTHTASHQAWYAAVNPLFGALRSFKVDYSVIPWTTFTDPEVARVGLNEQEAARQGVQVEVTRFRLDDLDRALADEEGHGFVKVLTPPGKDRILGVTIVGHHAGDLMAEFVLAMKWGLGLKKVMNTIHIYPTLSEASKFAASAWRKDHAPERLLQWAQRFHAWRRGRAA